MKILEKVHEIKLENGAANLLSLLLLSVMINSGIAVLHFFIAEFRKQGQKKVERTLRGPCVLQKSPRFEVVNCSFQNRCAVRE